MLDCLREVGFCGLDRLEERFPSCEMRGDGGSKGATGTVGMRRVDELPFEDMEEPPIVE